MQRTQLRLESLVVLFVFPFTLQQALPKRAILRASQKGMDKGEYLCHVKKAGWKMKSSEVKTEFTFVRVLYKIMELFFGQPQNSLFSDATIFFPIYSQVTFSTDKHVKELLMERFGMVTPQDFAKQFQK